MTSALRHLLAVLLLLGIGAMPFAGAAMARGAAPMAGMDMAAMAMADGAPCCPDDVPMPGCAKSCPLKAICMTKCAPDAPAAAALEARPFVTAAAVLPHNDTARALHGAAPPARPPRS